MEAAICWVHAKLTYVFLGENFGGRVGALSVGPSDLTDPQPAYRRTPANRRSMSNSIQPEAAPNAESSHAVVKVEVAR